MAICINVLNCNETKSPMSFISFEIVAHIYISTNKIDKELILKLNFLSQNTKGLSNNLWYDMIWYDMIWYDMIWYDMIW